MSVLQDRAVRRRVIDSMRAGDPAAIEDVFKEIAERVYSDCGGPVIVAQVQEHLDGKVEDFEGLLMLLLCQCVAAGVTIGGEASAELMSEAAALAVASRDAS